MKTFFEQISSVDQDFLTRAKKIIQLIEDKPDSTCKEIAVVLELNETAVADDLKRIHKNTKNSTHKKKFYDNRVISLIKRFPDISFRTGGFECGLHMNSFRGKCRTLTKSKKIPIDYLEKRQKHAHSTEATPIADQLLPKKDLTDTDTNLTQYNSAKITDALTQLIDSENISLDPKDLMGTDEVINRLWVTVVKSVVSNKLKPKNFSEAKQLLTMLMQYMEAVDERKRREADKDTFRQYRDFTDEEIFMWIDDAIAILIYINTDKNVDHLNEIRKQLLDIDKE